MKCCCCTHYAEGRCVNGLNPVYGVGKKTDQHNCQSYVTKQEKDTMKKIQIRKTPKADTRTVKGHIELYELDRDSRKHIEDVKGILWRVGRFLQFKGRNHDWTKTKHIEIFYKDFIATVEDGASFVKGQWYKKHIKEERHHLNENCPNDVNIFDVIEMIADNVAAGLARSGEVRDVPVSDEILRKSYENTVKLIASWCEVRKDEN